ARRRLHGIAAMRLDFKVSEDAAGQRLHKLLRRRMENLPPNHLYNLVPTKKGPGNGPHPQVAQLLNAGGEITCHVLQPAKAPPPRPATADRHDSKILYEDHLLPTSAKPAGLPIHPGTGVAGEPLVVQARPSFERQALQTAEGEFKPSPAHRLD